MPVASGSWPGNRLTTGRAVSIVETVTAAPPAGLAFVNKFANGTDVVATAFDLQTWTPTAGLLYMLALAPVQNSGATLPTVTNTNGMTWTRALIGGEFGGAG